MEICGGQEGGRGWGRAKGRPEAREEHPLRKRGPNLTNETNAPLVDHVMNHGLTYFKMKFRIKLSVA